MTPIVWPGEGIGVLSFCDTVYRAPGWQPCPKGLHGGVGGPSKAVAVAAPIASRIQNVHLETFMVFTPFTWISLTAGTILQFLIFYKLREPKSLRWLMMFLCLENVTCAALHPWPIPYWIVLWTFRVIVICWFTWSAGDVISMPGRTHWFLRVPVLVNLAMGLWTNPYSAQTTVHQLESYRWHALVITVLMVLIGIVFLIPDEYSPKFAFALGGCLLAELFAAAIGAMFGPASAIQIFLWLAGLCALAAFARESARPVHTALLSR